jgi:hypothetical protein
MINIGKRKEDGISAESITQDIIAEFGNELLV